MGKPLKKAQRRLKERQDWYDRARVDKSAPEATRNSLNKPGSLKVPR